MLDFLRLLQLSVDRTCFRWRFGYCAALALAWNSIKAFLQMAPHRILKRTLNSTPCNPYVSRASLEGTFFQDANIQPFEEAHDLPQLSLPGCMLVWGKHSFKDPAVRVRRWGRALVVLMNIANVAVAKSIASWEISQMMLTRTVLCPSAPALQSWQSVFEIWWTPKEPSFRQPRTGRKPSRHSDLKSAKRMATTDADSSFRV